jgi:hypothetical protein
MSVMEARPTRAMTNEEALHRMEGLDLRMVRMKLADPKEGQGWTPDQLDLFEREYRRFLALNLLYPFEAIVPCHDVDMFWHAHILDTAAYRVDCDAIFGEFFDHFPYFGLRGEDDAAALDVAYERTLALYEHEFGATPAGVWRYAQKCGRTACKPQKCRGTH